MNRDMRRMINDSRRDGARGRRGGYRRSGDYASSDMNYDGNYNTGRGEYRGEIRGDFGYDDDYDMRDGRRGVKGTGPYGIGGRLHYPRRDRASYDPDLEYDGYNEPMRLSKRDMTEWKRGLENDDGTQGPHFDMQQIEQAAEALGIRPRGYDMSALCMVANMYYSHLGELNKQFLPKEKEAMYYTKAAKKWLDDPDAAVHGDEKLAAYYYTIVCDDE